MYPRVAENATGTCKSPQNARNDITAEDAEKRREMKA
jgi:hypothetical protein